MREGQQDLARQFDDPRYTPRRLCAELFGTFFLVLVAAGADVVNAQSGGQVPLAVRVTAPGLMVLALILSLGEISGAHVNPAVSLAFALRGAFPWRRVPSYVAAQLVGATLAALVLKVGFGSIGSLGRTEPGPHVSQGLAFSMETILTLGLVVTILGAASRARNIGGLSALAVGSYIVLAGLWSAPISGASMNPARSLGPVIVTGVWHDWWIYVGGPLLGALLAVAFTRFVRGPVDDREERRAAQGDGAA